jgi:hypothetical protein
MSTVPERGKTRLNSTHPAFLAKTRSLKHDEEGVSSKDLAGRERGFRNPRVIMKAGCFPMAVSGTLLETRTGDQTQGGADAPQNQKEVQPDETLHWPGR